MLPCDYSYIVSHPRLWAHWRQGLCLSLCPYSVAQGPASHQSLMKICYTNEWMNETTEWRGKRWRIWMGTFIKISSIILNILLWLCAQCQHVHGISLWYNGNAFSSLWRYSLTCPRHSSIISLIYDGYIHQCVWQVLRDMTAHLICLWDERKREDIIYVKNPSFRHIHEKPTCVKDLIFMVVLGMVLNCQLAISGSSHGSW